MTLAIKIIALEFSSAVVIVLATRAIARNSYSLVAATEFLFVAQWFAARNLSFDDPASRSWRTGFPAYAIGAIVGSLLGLWLSNL